MDDETKAAYAELERAIEVVLRLRGAEGMLTDYFSIAAVQSVSDDGEMDTSIVMLLPNGDGLPYHRVLGLLDYTQTVMRAEAARNELDQS